MATEHHSDPEIASSQETTPTPDSNGKAPSDNAEFEKFSATLGNPEDVDTPRDVTYTLTDGAVAQDDSPGQGKDVAKEAFSSEYVEEMREAAKSRQGSMGNLIGLQVEQPDKLTVVAEETRGVVVVMPSYNDKNVDRTKTVAVAMQSLADQRAHYRDPIKFVLADNGITDDQQRVINGKAQELNLDILFADARAQTGNDANAGYARNQAVKEIMERARQDESFRGHIFTLDDDNAAGWKALARLSELLEEEPAAAAIGTRAVPTTALTQRNYEEFIESRQEQGNDFGNVAVHLPRVYKGDILSPEVDLASIVAFGGQVAPKTSGLLIRSSAVRSIIDRGESLFVKWPDGSFEDMMLDIALNKQGRLLRSEGAETLDQVRESSEQIKRQHMRWGSDHVIACNDFTQLKLQPKGMRVLEPDKDGRWRQWTLPQEDAGGRGIVINPKELRAVADHLKTQITDTYRDRPDEFLGVDGSGAIIKEELPKLFQMLNNIRTNRGTHLQMVNLGHPSPKEIPTPEESVGEQARWHPDNRAASLAGNLLGNHKMRQQYDGKEAVLYGIRQHVK